MKEYSSSKKSTQRLNVATVLILMHRSMLLSRLPTSSTVFLSRNRLPQCLKTISQSFQMSVLPRCSW